MSRLLPHWACMRDPGDNLVELVRRIAARFGATTFGTAPSPAPSLDALPLSGRSVVVLLVDGLGDAYVNRHRSSALFRARRGALSSVFPTTTASAITSLMTGLYPVRHGLLGWHIHDARFGGVIAPLPMVVRGGAAVEGAFRLRRLFPYPTLYQGMPCRSTVVAPMDILQSPFNRRHSRGARRAGYAGLAGLGPAIVDAVRANGDAGGFVYAYYPVFDSIAHAFGVDSPQAAEVFARIDAAFSELVERLAGAKVDLILTADHGFIDVGDDRTLDLSASARLQAMLAAPLWGERRAAFCRLRAGAGPEFECAMPEFLDGKGVVVDSAELHRAGLFGSGRAHARLAERLGDKAMIMAPGWALRDSVAGEREHRMIGLHGGLSAQEMYVPLIHVNC
jgi:hypothetical protein